LEWGVLKKEVFVVNIYSGCDLNSKRRLWEALIVVKRQLGGGVWGLVGDFNAVLHRDERRGQSLSNSISVNPEIVEFRDFIAEMNLVDLPVLGRKFTWFHSNGFSMSRLDRMLLSDDWLSLWSNPSLWVLPRTVSDHCSILLRYSGADWGPKPFRFNNHWLLHKDFPSLVEDFWRNNNTTGWMAFVLKEKLKGLKNCIREWNKINYGLVDSKIDKLVGDIRDLDLRIERVGLSAEEVVCRKQLFDDMWHLRISKVSQISQRSRQNWLRDGDSNTRFFHASIKSRSKRNHIAALRVNDVWMDSPSLIRQATVDYFKFKFSADLWARPKLDGISFPSLSEDENQ
jgi:hypothetical protein